MVTTGFTTPYSSRYEGTKLVETQYFFSTRGVHWESETDSRASYHYIANGISPIYVNDTHTFNTSTGTYSNANWNFSMPQNTYITVKYGVTYLSDGE